MRRVSGTNAASVSAHLELEGPGMSYALSAYALALPSYALALSSYALATRCPVRAWRRRVPEGEGERERSLAGLQRMVLPVYAFCCYAILSTDSAYATTRCPGTDSAYAAIRVAYAATRCPGGEAVTIGRKYSGESASTDGAFAYAKSGTGIAYAAVCLCDVRY
eukprot:314598-Rhodomonas_salina.3